MMTNVIRFFNIQYIVKHGGIICNCGSWYKEEGANPLLSEVMNTIKPDLVLVIHDEQVYVEISYLLLTHRVN